MAGITLIGAVNVIGSFTAGNGAVMAADAGTNDFGVIHRGRCNRHPRIGPRQMTGIADIRGINVRCTHTGRNHAIMATDAGADDLAMIHRGSGYGCPQCR